MEDNNINTNQQQPQQQAQQQPCPGNCAGCSIYQRNFCSAKLGHTNMKLIEALINGVNTLGDEIKLLKEKIDAFQSSAEELINPTQE